jgi:hypothetical protein
MFDKMTIVAQVANWDSLGVKLPKPLAEKLSVFEAVRYVEVAYPVPVDTAAITAKNAEESIHRLAGQLVPTLAEPGKRSALESAKVSIMGRLGSEVLALASDAVPEMVEQLRPGFERATSLYVETVTKLPEELTSEAVVKAGPSVLADFQTAQSAAQVIATVDSWLAGLTQLPGYAGSPSEPTLRVLAPSTRAELAELLTAHSRHNADPLEIELGTVYLAAARAGIAFALNTPAESAQIRRSIESSPIEKTRDVAWR